jgi:arylsulfatase
MLFESDEPTPGCGGHVTLFIDSKPAGSGDMPRTVPVAFSSYAGMDIGRDNGLVVDLDYEDQAPYAFTGTIKSVVFDLQPLAHEDETSLHEQALKHTLGQGAAG